MLVIDLLTTDLSPFCTLRITVLRWAWSSSIRTQRTVSSQQDTWLGDAAESGADDLMSWYRETASSTSESGRWVQEQMRICKETHSRCSTRQRGHGHLPTRVIAIDRSSAAIQLVTPARGTVGQYACLSHCWGKSQPLKTCKNNINAFKDHIPWDLLPRTFQEAIEFARGLDIPYIWIDSLCVVQDDGEDWAREAAKMASIYQNSMITLAGTKSNSSEQGLFSRDPLPTNARRLEFADGHGKPHILYVRLRRPHWDDKIGNDYSHAQQRLYPLLTRAWCFQERLLSPRFVHFCGTELVWECMELSTCQCGLFRPTFQLKLPGSTSFGLPQKDARAHQGEDHNWKEIIQKYSQLAITYDRDRLVALLGLADDAQQFHKGRCLAGLWEDAMVEHLLWYVSNDPTGQRPNLHSPPTWSWASTGAPISFRDVADHMCEIIEVDYSATAESAQEKKTSQGRLVIRGHLIPATIQYENTDKERIKVLGKYIRPDYEFWSTESSGTHVLDGGQVFCLTIGRDPEDWGCMSILVLVCTDFERRQFERIGMFWIQSPDGLVCYPEWEVLSPESEELVKDDAEKEDSTSTTPELESRAMYWIQFVYSNEYGGNIEAADNFLASLDGTSMKRSFFTKLTREQLMANLTEEEAELVKSNVFVKQVVKGPKYQYLEMGKREWFMAAQDVERKGKGQPYFRYVGETVTIV
jgi:hypothetical protein